MTITKTLMLGALAALSLGIASANAQSLTPSSVQAAYFAAEHQTNATHGTVSTPTDAMQSGSPDIERSQPAIRMDTNLTAGGGG